MPRHKFLPFNSRLLTSNHRGTKGVVDAIIWPLQPTTPLKGFVGEGEAWLGTATMDTDHELVSFGASGSGMGREVADCG